MAFSDEIDHTEHANLQAQVAEERRTEQGWRITVTVAWERSAFGINEEFEQDFADDLRGTLVRVAEMGAGFQTNSIVRSNMEKLGGDE